jgi:hypothetical protein
VQSDPGEGLGRGLAVPVVLGNGTNPVSLEEENAFDFDGDVPWEWAHADGAAGTDAVFGAEYVRKEFATAVDDLGVVEKIRGGIDHTEEFDDPFDSVEGAEL